MRKQMLKTAVLLLTVLFVLQGCQKEIYDPGTERDLPDIVRQAQTWISDNAALSRGSELEIASLDIRWDSYTLSRNDHGQAIVTIPVRNSTPHTREYMELAFGIDANGHGRGVLKRYIGNLSAESTLLYLYGIDGQRALSGTYYPATGKLSLRRGYSLSAPRNKLNKIASTSSGNDNNSEAGNDTQDGGEIEEVVVTAAGNSSSGSGGGGYTGGIGFNSGNGTPSNPIQGPVINISPSGNGGGYSGGYSGGYNGGVGGVYFPVGPGSGGTGGSSSSPTLTNGPGGDPCVKAKRHAEALLKALMVQKIKDAVDLLKQHSATKADEYGFAIIKTAGGYDITEIVKGTPTSVTLSTAGNVIAILHTHPQGSSAAPSSTDILGLNSYKHWVAHPDFAGSVIIRGNEMNMISITDKTKYDDFVLKVNNKGWYDKDTDSGWKGRRSPKETFDDFVNKSSGIYQGEDLAYAAHLYNMDRHKMGVSLQRYDAATGTFVPQKVSVQNRNTGTGSSTSISGGGQPLDNKYLSVTLDKSCN